MDHQDSSTQDDPEESSSLSRDSSGEEATLDKPEIIRRLNILKYNHICLKFDEKMPFEELVVIYQDAVDCIRREDQERTDRARLCVYSFLLVQKGTITIAESNNLMQPDISNAQMIQVLSRYL